VSPAPAQAVGIDLVGLMSGTSLDSVDGVICRFGPAGEWHGVIAHAHRPFPAALREDLLNLQQPGPDELHRAALAGNAIARCYAEVVDDLIGAQPAGRTRLRAIGAHGQTVRHQPGLHDGTGYTVQLLNGALLAERTGLDVIADLRSRDVAAGGQGAPLVPAFHAAVFGHPDRVRAIVNIGGISNLTVLRPDEAPRGFDCGPGNALMDHWVTRHHPDCLYDADGAWAATGQVDAALLGVLRAEPYFALPAPKSTGRDLFHPAWLQQHLAELAALPSAQDVQATLCELTAATIADDLRRQAPDASELLVCGGGAFNGTLMRRLRTLTGLPVEPTDAAGLPAMQVEAAAFAWLAWRHLHRQPGNEPAVTGAAGPRILGTLHPA
jgi:anhydro-N-acetylmuramic acid kinase